MQEFVADFAELKLQTLVATPLTLNVPPTPPSVQVSVPVGAVGLELVSVTVPFSEIVPATGMYEDLDAIETLVVANALDGMTRSIEESAETVIIASESILGNGKA